MLAWLTSLSKRKQIDRVNLAMSIALAQNDPKALAEIMESEEPQEKTAEKWWEAGQD